MNALFLPLTNRPNQKFQTTLAVDDQNLTFDFFVRFNELAGYWLMDISKDGVDLIASLPLVPGDEPTANLLHQYQYLEIGSMFLFKIGTSAEEYPGETTLEDNWAVVWGDTR